MTAVGILLIGTLPGIETVNVTLFMTGEDEKFNQSFGEISDLKKGGMNAMFPISVMTGSIIAGFCASKTAKKTAIIVGSFLWTNCYLLQCFEFCWDYNAYMCLRAARGVCIGILIPTIFLYLRHVMLPNQSNKLMSIFGMMNPLAITMFLTIDVANYNCSENWCLSIPFDRLWAFGGIPGYAAFVFMMGSINSPEDRFLKTNNLDDKWFVNYINKIYGSKSSREEAIDWYKTSMAVKEPTFKAYKNKANRVRLGCSLAVQLFMGLTGNTFVVYYVPTVMTEIGITGETNKYLVLALFITVTLVTLVASQYIPSKSRVRMQVTGYYLLATVNGILAVIKSCLDNIEMLDQVREILTAVFLFLICLIPCIFSFFLATSGVLYASEILPSNARDSGMCFSQALGWFINFLVAQAAPWLIETIKEWLFVLFSCFCIIAFILASRYSNSDTKGLNDCNIARLYVNF